MVAAVQNWNETQKNTDDDEKSSKMASLNSNVGKSSTTATTANNISFAQSLASQIMEKADLASQRSEQKNRRSEAASSSGDESSVKYVGENMDALDVRLIVHILLYGVRLKRVS